MRSKECTLSLMRLFNEGVIWGVAREEGDSLFLHSIVVYGVWHIFRKEAGAGNKGNGRGVVR